MSQEDIFVDKAEQLLCGYTIIFTGREEHRIALRYIESERASFDRWAAKHIRGLKTPPSVPCLVTSYLGRFLSLPPFEKNSSSRVLQDRYKHCEDQWRKLRAELQHLRDMRDVDKYGRKYLTAHQLYTLMRTSSKHGLHVTSRDATLSHLRRWELVRVYQHPGWDHRVGTWYITQRGLDWLAHNQTKASDPVVVPASAT